MGGHVARRDDAKAPVRTEPHPTSPRCLHVAYMTSPPIQLVDQLTKNPGGHVARRDDEKSPGSDGASPYQSAASALPRR